MQMGIHFSWESALLCRAIYQCRNGWLVLWGGFFCTACLLEARSSRVDLPRVFGISILIWFMPTHVQYVYVFVLHTLSGRCVALCQLGSWRLFSMRDSDFCWAYGPEPHKEYARILFFYTFDVAANIYRAVSSRVVRSRVVGVTVSFSLHT